MKQDHDNLMAESSTPMSTVQNHNHFKLSHLSAASLPESKPRK